MSRNWKPGWVTTLTRGPVKVEKDQRWAYCPTLEPYEEDSPLVLPLTVVSTSPTGEVVLRPRDPQRAETMFPLRETLFKGKPTTTRHCPFAWVEERQAKGSKGEYQVGDLLAHEAWDVWDHMHLHQT
jgi:hypothetical protein